MNTGTTPENYTTNALNEYSSVGTKTFQYDLDGNLTQRLDSLTNKTTQYQYDLEDHLVKVTLPDASTVSFTYDAQGRRISKTAVSATTRYLWDGSELLAELSPSGNLLRSYAHGPEVDEILYQEDYSKNETLFFHQDNLESAMALTDASGQVKESFTYDPYGNLITKPSSPSTHFLYTGRELDSETGLYYNRARYYDPSLGRFISADPKGYSAGLNLYTYTRNNPLSFRDPEGLDVYWGGYGYGGWGGFRGAVSSFFGDFASAVSNAISYTYSAISYAASAVASAVSSGITTLALGAVNVAKAVGSAVVQSATDLVKFGFDQVRFALNHFGDIAEATAHILTQDVGGLINQGVNLLIEHLVPNLAKNPIIEFAREGAFTPKGVAEYTIEIVKKNKELDFLN